MHLSESGNCKSGPRVFQLSQWVPVGVFVCFVRDEVYLKGLRYQGCTIGVLGVRLNNQKRDSMGLEWVKG